MLEVAVALVRREGRLLFLRRDRPPMTGLWELPGGKIERGEDAASCAVRELYEETGLRGEAPQVLGSVLHGHLERVVRLTGVAVEAGGAPTAGVWLERPQWRGPQVLPGTRALIQTLFPE